MKNFKMKNNMKTCVIISGVIVLIALVMTISGHGLNLGVDFTGGTLMTYNMGSDYNASDVESVLNDLGITDVQVAKIGNENEVQIRISDNENTDELRAQLESRLSEKYPDIAYVDITRVGAVAGRDLVNNAIKSICVAAVLMLLYIAVRFDFFSGLAAIIGLLHDILIMISISVILRGFMRIETTYIAALLTIVGYSINNTIIIFDRIRENSRKPAFRTTKRDEIVNVSVTESLGRTLNTTATTLITVVVLYIMGVDSIKLFALPLIIGILAGTYSANFINGYVWAALKDANDTRKKVKAKA